MLDREINRMNDATLKVVYRAMLAAREIDRLENEITSRGEAFFHVSGAGHEGSAMLAPLLQPSDWLHCHYRDKALMLARGVSIKSFFDNLYCKRDGQSQGRQMSAHMCDPNLHVMSITGPVGNSALQSVGVALAIREHEDRPLVLCSIGDGTTQEGEFLEACAEAHRSQAPVLFLIEDNGWAISTPTAQKTFYSLSEETSFHGIPIQHLDGRKPHECWSGFERVVRQIRETRGPQLVVLHVERLANHTNADDQSLYRSQAEIAESRSSGDPIHNLESELARRGMQRSELELIFDQVQAEVAREEEASAMGPEPVAAMSCKRTLSVELTHPSRERSGVGGGDQLTMKDAMREVLQHYLLTDPNVYLWGEDIEDPKGDVFGITKGLSTRFPGRVQNSPLTESTIVGVAVGRALAGQRPVAFLQFADFLPLAYNQIAAEMASMYWRTAGGYESPVILMIPCGGYRPGLGPFHSHSLESIAAHTPGVDVFMPSTAADAAGLLNAAFQSRRPTLFFYPKSCLNDPQRTTSSDVQRQFVPIGTARKARNGRDITFVGWGNTVRLCEKAADDLERAGVESEILDLRCIHPWDEKAILASVEKTARLVVVHEDNHTCGVGAEIIATVAEKTKVPVAFRRVTRSDTLVPCNFANQLEVLPSYQRVLTQAAELLGLDVSWEQPKPVEAGLASIEAIGSGPADETVTVVEIYTHEGEEVERGQPVASLEATKSVFDLTSPVDGCVEDLLVSEGDVIEVGSTMFRVRTSQAANRPKPITQENPGTPRLTRRHNTSTIYVPAQTLERRPFDVGISEVTTVSGSRIVPNQSLLHGRTDMTAQDIVRRTGIEQRRWVAEGEDAINMAVRACWQLLDRESLCVDDLDLVICSTTSPNSVTPSMACQVLNGLQRGQSKAMLQAYDINAACSGYLYALQAGYDYLQSAPNARVLVVTAEVLSPLLDLNDFDTAILFGDATSATILYGEEHFDRAKARLVRPDLSAKGEDGSTLSVPFRDSGYIQMKGNRVFSEAVRSMVASLNRVCQRQGLDVNQLDLIVPHQANQRIIDAIQNRIETEVFSNIRKRGNTSSSSIPLCLEEVLPRLKKGEQVGLCAFGGGFTFGAGILESN